MSCDVPALWNEYQERLFAYIKKRVKDPYDAKDIHQEVLIKVFNFCNSKSGVNKIDSWLYQIAHNAIIDYHKKKAKFTPLVKFDEDSNPEDPEDITIDAANYILPLIELIPREYGEPLIRSDIKNLKQKDIAEQLGLTLTATKSRIQRARKLVKEKYMECFHLQFTKDGGIADISLKDDCKPLQEYKSTIAKK